MKIICLFSIDYYERARTHISCTARIKQTSKINNHKRVIEGYIQ